MKKVTKTIKITKTTIEGKDNYVFSENDSKLFEIECSKKTINGKDLFEKIYKTESDDVVKVVIDISVLDNDDKKTFGNYVKTLFDKINDAMDKQFPGVE